jgi:hypothetical protein
MSRGTKGEGDGREARRLLRRLARDGAAVPADDPLAGHLLRRRLLARTGEGFALTAEGRAYLRRSLMPDEGFALQHQERATILVADAELGAQPVRVNLDESPLAWLRRRKGRDGKPLIDAAEFAAGERLRSDFTRAQMMPRITANWTASVAGGRRDGTMGAAAELGEVALDARRRVRRALEAVGPDFAGLLLDVCCFMKSVEAVEASRSWPARSAKVVVRLALASLARHYGLAAEARGRGGVPLRHWGADDYRPTIE